MTKFKNQAKYKKIINQMEYFIGTSTPEEDRTDVEQHQQREADTIPTEVISAMATKFNLQITQAAELIDTEYNLDDYLIKTGIDIILEDERSYRHDGSTYPIAITRDHLYIKHPGSDDLYRYQIDQKATSSEAAFS